MTEPSHQLREHSIADCYRNFFPSADIKTKEVVIVGLVRSQ